MSKENLTLNEVFDLALKNHQNNNLQDAQNYYQKVLKIDPSHVSTLYNLGFIFKALSEYQKAKSYFEKSVTINSNDFEALGNIADIYVSQLTDLEIAISKSNETLKIYHKNYRFVNQSIPLFKLKHDVQQANYLSSKNYKINGIDEFIKTGDEILGRKENEEDKNGSNKKILLNNEEVNSLLPYSKENHTYQIKTISGSCINPNKNWLDVEDEYLNSANQIMYIDDFYQMKLLLNFMNFA